MSDDLRAAAETIESQIAMPDPHADKLATRLRQHADTIERVEQDLDDVSYTLNTSLLERSIKALRGEQT